jgi:glycosyltransferase involved in cell wall biosynthesis
MAVSHRDIRIAVALPVKNGMPHLKAAIAGIASQSHKNFAVYVQDSESTDGSLEFLRSLDVPFPLDIVSEADRSLTDGYDRAIARCQGDLVVAAACDEIFEPNAFRKYARWHLEHPEAILIYSATRLIDGAGRTLSYFKPLEFDLVDYIRHRMCPTTAGPFNKKILGDDLRLDTSLKSVPDFELVIRLALKYGPDKFIAKSDVTVSHRGDDSSMSYRPAALKQLCSDKLSILDALFDDPLRQKFSKFLRDDAAFSVLIANSAAAHTLGDLVQAKEFLFEAQTRLAGHQRAKEMANLLSLEWDEATQRVLDQPRSMLETPPPDARRSQSINPDDIASIEVGLRAGASLRPLPDGIRIAVPPIVGGYAAFASLDFTDVSFRKDRCWLKLEVRDTVGDCTVSLFDPDDEEIVQETTLFPGAERRTVILKVPESRTKWLLFRTGRLAESASTVFLGAELLVSPKHASTPERQSLEAQPLPI